MVGDLGFDPLGVSSYTNMMFAREAELKHGRIAMLAFAGIVVETLGIKAPGAAKIYGTSTVRRIALPPVIDLWIAPSDDVPLFCGQDIFELHNLAVQKGSMGQILLWCGFLEMVGGVPAMWAMLEGSGRMPGDFAFDPLGLGKKDMAKNRELTHPPLSTFQFCRHIRMPAIMQQTCASARSLKSRTVCLRRAR